MELFQDLNGGCLNQPHVDFAIFGSLHTIEDIISEHIITTSQMIWDPSGTGSTKEKPEILQLGVAITTLQRILQSADS